MENKTSKHFIYSIIYVDGDIYNVCFDCGETVFCLLILESIICDTTVKSSLQQPVELPVVSCFLVFLVWSSA